MNKQGKQGMGTGTKAFLIVLAVIVTLSLVTTSVYQLTGGFGRGTADEEQKKDTELSVGDCSTAPTINIDILDKFNKGTTVTADWDIIKNNAYVGNKSSSDTFAKGDVIKPLISATNYLDIVLEEKTLSCGINNWEAELAGTDVATVKVFDDENVLLTDSATQGASFADTFSTPVTYKIQYTTSTDDAIDKVTCVFESDNTTQVDDMSLSSASSDIKVSRTDKPELHSSESSTNTELIKSFEISDLADDGGVSILYLTVTPETGQSVNATAFYMTCYNEQAFVDVSGQFVDSGVEDSDGTAKYEDTYDYDWYVA